MLICANPFRGPEGAPMRRFAGGILWFAVAATLIQSAPLQTKRIDPRFLASGIALAVLPAAMLAANQLNRTRLMIAMLLAIVTALCINQWTREVHTATAFAVFAVALGLLGTAIGRAQPGAAIRPRVPAAAWWWFLTWMAYQVLQFGARELRASLLLPLSTAVWLPPLVVLLIAVVALAKTKGGAEASGARELGS